MQVCQDAICTFWNSVAPSLSSKAGQRSAFKPFHMLTNYSTCENVTRSACCAETLTIVLTALYVCTAAHVVEAQASRAAALLAIDACAENECKCYAPQGSAWRESVRNLHASDTACS